MFPTPTPPCTDCRHPGVRNVNPGVKKVNQALLSVLFIVLSKIQLMSHAYVVRPKVDKSGETEKIRYYGVPVTSGQVSTEQLATYISTRCTFSRGEILAAIIEIGREIQFQLDMGYTINLHGIGTLFLSAGSEGYENPKDCTPHRVKAKRLCIKANPEMKKFIKRLKFERWK